MAPDKAARRSCDLCYTKRIKCDAKKPRCSNCALHNSECTHAAASRRASRRRQTEILATEPLQCQLQHLETRLAKALDRLERLEDSAAQADVAGGSSSQLVAAKHCVSDGLLAVKPHCPPLELPAQQQVLSATEKYLTTSNSFLPLFEAGNLLRSVHRWYSHPELRTRATWAAINVVLALAYCQPDSDEANPAKRPKRFIDNAQSVLTELTVQDVELVNVQVLVGLTMLFQGALDLGPSAILLATALRLAHGLRLHTRSGSANLSPSQELERDRVFWIIYILDRDISLRTKSPPLQLETEMDLDLPSDGLGEDSGHFNFLRARVQLAHIQGKVYSSLYSVRAQHSPPEKRDEELAAIRDLLHSWASCLPPQANLSVLTQGGTPILSRYFGVLYATRLTCLTLASQARLWDRHWLDGLQAHRTDIANQAAAPVPLPHNWPGLVYECREFMSFYMAMEPKDASFIWMTSCTYIACLVCLLINGIISPPEDFSLDKHLSVMALMFVDDMVLQTADESITKIRDSCRELMLHTSFISQKDQESSSN